MAKKRITLMLPPELWARTQQVARERHTSASEYVARALQDILSLDDREARLLAVREMAAMDLAIADPDELCREAGERYEACVSRSEVR